VNEVTYYVALPFSTNDSESHMSALANSQQFIFGMTLLTFGSS
jgi:hypothetical protein